MSSRVSRLSVTSMPASASTRARRATCESIRPQGITSVIFCLLTSLFTTTWPRSSAATAPKFV
jgi:hypothetical protein